MSDLLDHPTSVRQGEELDLTKLEPYLREHFPNEAGPLQVRQYPSGHSNLTYSLQLSAKELLHGSALQGRSRRQFIPNFFRNVSDRNLDRHAFIMPALQSVCKRSMARVASYQLTLR